MTTKHVNKKGRQVSMFKNPKIVQEATATAVHPSTVWCHLINEVYMDELPSQNHYLAMEVDRKDEPMPDTIRTGLLNIGITFCESTTSSFKYLAPGNVIWWDMSVKITIQLSYRLLRELNILQENAIRAGLQLVVFHTGDTLNNSKLFLKFSREKNIFVKN